MQTRIQHPAQTLQGLSTQLHVHRSHDCPMCPPHVSKGPSARMAVVVPVLQNHAAVLSPVGRGRELGGGLKLWIDMKTA